MLLIFICIGHVMSLRQSEYVQIMDDLLKFGLRGSKLVGIQGGKFVALKPVQRDQVLFEVPRTALLTVGNFSDYFSDWPEVKQLNFEEKFAAYFFLRDHIPHHNNLLQIYAMTIKPLPKEERDLLKLEFVEELQDKDFANDYLTYHQIQIKNVKHILRFMEGNFTYDSYYWYLKHFHEKRITIELDAVIDVKMKTRFQRRKIDMIVPVVDMIMQGSNNNLYFEYDEPRQTLLVRASQFLTKGEQLVIKKQQLQQPYLFTLFDTDFIVDAKAYASVKFCYDLNNTAYQRTLQYVQDQKNGCVFVYFNDRSDDERQEQFIDTMNFLRFLSIDDEMLVEDILDLARSRKHSGLALRIKPFSLAEEVIFLAKVKEGVLSKLAQFPTSLRDDLKEFEKEVDPKRARVLQMRIKIKRILLELRDDLSFLISVYQMPKDKRRQLLRSESIEVYRDKLSLYFELMSTVRN